MVFAPYVAKRWSLLTPVFVLVSPVLADDQALYSYDEESRVGAPYRAYHAGVGHTVASDRRPLDDSLRYAPVEPDPVIDWSGTYFGGTVGGVFTTTDLDGNLNQSIDADSYVLSGHAGINYQVGSVVFGPELDASITDATGSAAAAGGVSTKSELDWLASARLRAGYTIDNILLYGTAGVALTSSDVEISAAGFQADSQEFHAGYVVGGGAEMVIVDGVNARVEALHYGFSGDTLPTPSGNSDLDLDATTIRAGVSLKFK